MAELSILDPRVIPSVVREYDAPENLLGLTLINKTSDTQPFWEYDIEVHTAAVLEKYTTPNSEAVLIDQTPVSHMQGSYAYQRVKKRFSPTTLRLLRRIGESRATAAAGEERVVRETQVMRQEMLRAEEVAVWKMLQGNWSFTTEHGITYTIDYGVPDNHKATASTAWGAAGDTPVADITALKRRVERDCGYPISRAYMNGPTMARFVELPEVTGGFNTGTDSASKQGQLSDDQKRAFQNERMIPRWHGVDWFEYDGGYLADGIGSTYSPYIPDNMIIFLCDGGQNYRTIQYGPSLDDSAPGEWTGPFTKTWKEEDPSARQVLIEVQYMPILLNPFKVATLNIGNA